MSDETASITGFYDESGLVMPYVACRSRGGPYEDRAFVAGYMVGYLDTLLAKQHSGDTRIFTADGKDVGWTDCVWIDLVPQLELVAMRHGYAMTVEPDPINPGIWVQAFFKRQD